MSNDRHSAPKNTSKNDGVITNIWESMAEFRKQRGEPSGHESGHESDSDSFSRLNDHAIGQFGCALNPEKEVLFDPTSGRGRDTSGQITGHGFMGGRVVPIPVEGSDGTVDMDSWWLLGMQTQKVTDLDGRDLEVINYVVGTVLETSPGVWQRACKVIPSYENDELRARLAREASNR